MLLQLVPRTSFLIGDYIKTRGKQDQERTESLVLTHPQHLPFKQINASQRWAVELVYLSSNKSFAHYFSYHTPQQNTFPAHSFPSSAPHYMQKLSFKSKPKFVFEDVNNSTMIPV